MSNVLTLSMQGNKYCVFSFPSNRAAKAQERKRIAIFCDHMISPFVFEHNAAALPLLPYK